MDRPTDFLDQAYSVDTPENVTFAHEVAGIGNRSLGAALFADPRVGRGNLLVRALDGRDRRGRGAAACFAAGGVEAAQLAPLWARRSLFCRGQGRILVTEVFTPGIPGRP